MTTRMRRWGNDAVVRIPDALVKAVVLAPGGKMELRIRALGVNLQEGALPAKLAAMFAARTPADLQDETPPAKRSKGLVWCLAVAWLAGNPCPAVVVADAGLERSAALAANPAYSAVGWIEIQEGTSRYRGTGVLVSSEWVLTAAHNWLADAVTGLEFHIGGESYTAISGDWVQHPGWVASPEVSHTLGSDVALFHLSKPVTGVSPATLYGGVAELGALVTLVGAGSAGTAATGPRPNSTPLLYATTNVIDRVIGTGTGGLLAMDFDDGTAFHNSLAGTAIFDTLGRQVTSSAGLTVATLASSPQLSWLEGTSAAGDSGGPAFADFASGPQVVGLVSWGVNPTNQSNPYGSGSGDITYLTRTSEFNGWILATIPEPGTSSFIIVAVLASCLQRRKSGA